MSWRRVVRYLFWYLVVFYGLAVIGAAGLKAYKEKHFTKEKLEEMLTVPAGWRDQTNDVCKYFVHGDPTMGAGFIKVIFYCNNQKKAVNTLSLEAIKERKFSEIITSLGKILGFEPKLVLEGQWECYVDQKLLVDKSTIIKNKQIIECVRPGMNLNEVRAKL